MNRPAFFVPFAAVLWLGACVSTGGPETALGSAARASGNDAGSAREDAAIQTALQQARTAKSDYKISSEDLLDITVYQQGDLNRKLRVSQGGDVSIPLIGIVKVGGLTLSEATEVITSRLKEYVINPQVTLFIEGYGSKMVFVLGEVVRPGSYQLPPEQRLTVVEAISLAGGTTPIAAPDRTRVIRDADGRNQVINVEISAITKRGEKDKDIALKPNDVVYIPQSFF